MKHITFFVIALLAFAAIAADVRLAWNYDDSDVKFKVYYGTESGTYTQHVDAGTNRTATVTGLKAGTRYFFAATAYTPDAESDFSNEVEWMSPILAPGSLRIEVTVTP